MRKNVILLVLFLLLICVSGCELGGDVKVYDDTEDSTLSHEEISMTAVILNIDLEQNIIRFRDCKTATDIDLIYHGGVRISNAFGREIGLNEMKPGCVVDVVFYQDTTKLVSITTNTNTTVLTGIKKFAANKEEGKATYRGTSLTMSDFVVAFNHDGSVMDVSEVSTEDTITLYVYGSRLVSVALESGHGYVKLYNHDSYVGGMVEIGHDVIVPVTENMLVTVGEGTYNLIINKNGYSDSKKITVLKDSETMVDIADIAIPTGSAVFETTPANAKVSVNGNEISGHTYTNIYGSYTVKVEAEGYKTFRGSFKISQTVNSYTVNLVQLTPDEPDTEDTTTEQTTTEGTTSGDTTEEGNTEDGSTTETTESGTGVTTDNIITIKTPQLASVYVDGDYVGVSPVSFPKVTGTHTITLYKSGYLIKSYTITAVDDGKDDEYNFAELTSLSDLIQ